MEEEILLIKSIEERVGRSSGKAFWVIATDKGEYTCHEPKVFDELAKNQGNKCKLETLRTEKYNNIKSFIEVVEVGTAEDKAAAKSSRGDNKSYISQLTSYAKDLVVADKEKSMDEAIKSVVKAYGYASDEL